MSTNLSGIYFVTKQRELVIAEKKCCCCCCSDDLCNGDWDRSPFLVLIFVRLVQCQYFALSWYFFVSCMSPADFQSFYIFIEFFSRRFIRCFIFAIYSHTEFGCLPATYVIKRQYRPKNHIFKAESIEETIDLNPNEMLTFHSDSASA